MYRVAYLEGDTWRYRSFSSYNSAKRFIQNNIARYDEIKIEVQTEKGWKILP